MHIYLLKVRYMISYTTAYKAQLLMGQTKAVIGREDAVHHVQTMHTYNALKPEQRFVQEKNSLTKLSYKQKPLLQLPKREGTSMSVTCYECGQLGHIQTNCPHLMMKVRTAAVRTDSTVDPFLDPQDEEVLPLDKEGEGEDSEHRE